MKLEIIKETSPDGIWYSIEEDGKYVLGSSKRNLGEVEKIFDEIKKKESILTKEIIRSEEI